MSHIRTVKEAHEKQRAIYMNMCMADFISPGHRFRSRQLNSQRGSGSPKRAKKSRSQTDPSDSRPATTPRSQATGGEKQLGDEQARGTSMPGTPVEETCPPLPEHTATSKPEASLDREFVDLGFGDRPVVNTELEENDCEFREAGQPGSSLQEDEDVASFCRSLSNEQPQSDFSPTKDSDRSSAAATCDSSATTLRPHGLQSSFEPRGRSPSEQSKKGSMTSSRSPSPRNITEADHQRAFNRAVYLMRQSLDLSEFEGGGVVLLDTSANASSAHPVCRTREGDEGTPDAMAWTQGRPEGHSRQPSFATQHSSAAAYGGSMQERVVLAAASVTDGRKASNFGRADPTWAVTLTPPELQRMCKRHPRGKLYDLPDTVGTRLFDWDGRPIMSSLSTKLYELVLLRRQFPLAKQVIFVPMFHSNINRWTSCFAWTNSRYRVFSYDMDYLPVLSFCNAIRAERTLHEPDKG